MAGQGLLVPDPGRSEEALREFHGVPPLAPDPQDLAAILRRMALETC